jgi:hypothetical protein
MIVRQLEAAHKTLSRVFSCPAIEKNGRAWLTYCSKLIDRLVVLYHNIYRSLD